MNKSDLLHMSLVNMLRRKARTFLTVTGVVIGTSSIVIMMSLGLAMDKTYQDQLSQMGSLNIIQDYLNSEERTPEEIMNGLLRGFEEDISDSVYIAKVLSLGSTTSHLEQQVSPRGYRMLQKLPRIPVPIIENLVERFGLLSHILRATIEELDEVEGIGEVRARSIKNGLKRMQEQLILEYVV
jgi:DNA integrity scanning protein DisA with diadenylate cyclase activity